MTPAFQTAQILRSAGISTIPVKADKRPLLPWKVYQTRTPTEEEIAKWFARDSGIALCAGKIQCLDFDEKYSRGIFPRFVTRAEETGLDYLLGELIRQKTPSGGYHLVWRCEGQMIGNEKLASRPANETERKAGQREFSMIETRGDGGYFLISPSAGYSLETGDWSSIPVISEEDRDALLSLARSFDERPPVEATEQERDEFTAEPASNDLTPGDDFDAKADIPALLRQHGWKSAGSSQKYWTRPGKAKGISASWGVVPNRLFVFSSSTEFQQNHVYRPWHVYAVLQCGGDFARAAGELRRQGFGGGAKTKTLSQELENYSSQEPPGIEPTPDDPPGVEGIDPHGDAPTKETDDEKLWRLLRACQFDEDDQPPDIVPIYSLAEIIICTSGNLTAITAQAKVGKSALVTAMMAATMTDPTENRDCLSATGFNAKGRAVIYFDTEQSKSDFWWSVDRAKKRAGRARKPDWLRAHTITTFGAKMKRQALALSMANYAAAFGGIHSVIIDGVADLALDVNDAAECNDLVAELHGLAIRYDCAIVCVIHKNPGSDKTRGHLGSQIERKAETNLTLEKDDDVTVVWSAKQRRAPISKKSGPRFHWDEQAKMHVTTENATDRPAAKVVALLTLAQSVFKEGQTMRWRELIDSLTEERRTPSGAPVQRTVERWVSDMEKAKILSVFKGSYQLSNAALPT